MLVPGLLGSFFFRLVRLFIKLHIGLLALTIKVFAHQVQNRVNALMWVMLAETCKGRSILTQDSFEHLRCHGMLIHVPHLINQLCVSHDQTAFGAEGIFLSKLIDKLEAWLEEELCQLEGVAQTLKAWAHVASISKVVQANNAIFAISWALLHTNTVQFCVSLGRASRQVKVLVLLTAGLFAVPDTLTLALDT